MYFILKWVFIVKCVPQMWCPGYKKIETTLIQVLWCFQIIPWFRRMYMNSKDTKYIIWNANDKVIDKFFWHPIDSLKWENFENPIFALEAWNTRLALSTERIKLHGIQSYSHISDLWFCWVITYLHVYA